MLSISQTPTGRRSASTHHHCDSKLYPPSVTHLDWGSGKVRQLFDVLTLFSNDGSHCERWDEKVYRLRLLVSLLGTSTLAMLRPVDHTDNNGKTTSASPATSAQMQTEVLAKAAQFIAQFKLHWSSCPPHLALTTSFSGLQIWRRAFSAGDVFACWLKAQCGTCGGIDTVKHVVSGSKMQLVVKLQFCSRN